MNYTTTELLQSISDDLTTLKTNMAAKGVDISENDDFTSLADKIETMSSGAFKVASIAERDALTYAKEGDVCLVMSDEIYNIIPATQTIQAGVQIQFKPTVVLENELQAWSSLNYSQSSSDSWQGFSMLYYVTDQEKYITVSTSAGNYRYNTQDGITFEVQTDIPIIVPNDSISTSDTLGDLTKFFDVIQYQKAEYFGLYTYNGSAWVGIDFGDDVTAADVLSDKKFVKGTGLVIGTFPRLNSSADIAKITSTVNSTIVLPADSTGFFKNYPLEDFIYKKVDAQSVVNMTNLFSNSNNIEALDLSGWTWSSSKSIVTVGNAFRSMSKLKYLNISGMKLSQSLDPYTTLVNAFPSGLETLIWQNGNLGNCQFMNYYPFSELTNVKYIDFTNMIGQADFHRWQNFLASCNNLETLILKNFTFNNYTTTPVTFNNKSKLIAVDMSGVKFSTVNIGSCFTFINDKMLKELNLDLGMIVKPTSINYMFDHCESLETIDLSKFDLSNITNSGFQGIFRYCSSLKNIININQTPATSITSLAHTFMGCSSLEELDISLWTTTNVTSMISTFAICTSLKFLDIRNFTFDNVTRYDTMFGNSATPQYCVPANCLIIVKSQIEKDWILDKFAWLTNIKTVAEYEEEQNNS